MKQFIYNVKMKMLLGLMFFGIIAKAQVVNSVETKPIHVVGFTNRTANVNLNGSALSISGDPLTANYGSLNPSAATIIPTGRLSLNLNIGNVPGLYNVGVMYCDTQALPNCNGNQIIIEVIDTTSLTQNLAPVANDDYGFIPQNFPAEFNVIANDYDRNGDLLTQPVVITPAVFSTVFIQPGFPFIFKVTPNLNFIGYDTITYMVCDQSTLIPQPLCDTAQLIIQVSPLVKNQAPVAADEHVHTAVDAPIDIHVLRNDYDQDADSMIVMAASNGFSGGSIVINPNPQFITYTPNPGFVGFDSIRYVICDGPNAIVSMANGLCDTAMVVIAVYDPLTCNAVETNITCFGANNGSVIMNLNNGIHPYSYNWSTNATTQQISSLAPGTYYCTAMDIAGNVCIDSAIVTQPTNLVVSISNLGNVSCFGGNDGFINIQVSGGTPLYTFVWSNGTTTQNITNLISGNYTVTITDANGCTSTASATVNQPTQITVMPNQTNVTCYGGNNGAISLMVIGGAPPYNYNWSNGVVCQSTSCQNISAGTYSVTITDANGCIFVQNFTITQPNLPITITKTINDVSCFGGNDGSIDITVSNSVLPNNYLWSNNTIIEDQTNLTAGTYSITVTDNNGCSAEDTYVVGQALELIVNAGADATICEGNTMVMGGAPVATGGTGMLDYDWSPAASLSSNIVPNPTASPSQNATYTVIVTDGNGCTASDDISITVDIVSVTVNDTFGCENLDVLLYSQASSSTGSSILTHTWDLGDGSSDNSPQVTHAYSAKGSYQVQLTVQDANGCVGNGNAQVLIQDCVWPGDADNNGIADNYDLLAIGLAYDSTGASRLEQNNDWYAHYATDWTDTISGGINNKFQDCDGNGIVNALDTNAIILNFGSTHSKNESPAEWRGNIPALQISLSKDTVYAGDTLVASLVLGDVNNVVSNLYGIAYTFNYNAEIVDTNQTTLVYTNSFIGNTAQKISISKDLPSMNKIKTAVTRIDHNPVNGYGEIAKVNMIITTDNINGKNTLEYLQNAFYITGLKAITQEGNLIEINEGVDSAEVGYEPTSVIEKNKESIIECFPVPANQKLQIRSSEKILALTVYNMLGEKVISLLPNTNAEIITTSALISGNYFVTVKTESYTETKKISILH